MKRTHILLSVLAFLSFFNPSYTFSQDGDLKKGTKPENETKALILKINNKTQGEITTETICAGDDAFYIGQVTAIPPGAWTYPSPRWTGSGAAYIDNPEVNSITFNCDVPGDYEITFSATQGATTTSITQPITVKAKDPLTLVFPNVSPYNICEGSSVTFEASDASQYYWVRDDGTATYPDLVGIGASVVETPPGVGTWDYRLYGESAGGCPTDPAYFDFQIIVEEAATVDAGGPYEVCAGSGVILNGSIGGSASSAQWIGGLGSFNPGRDALNAEYTPHASEAGTNVNLILRTDDPAGVCSFVEDNATITVHELPAAPTANDITVCFDGNPHSASATPPAGASVVWYTASSGGTITTAPTGTAAATYTAWAESVDDVTACSSSSRTLVTLTINPLPAAPTANNVEVCYDGASHSASATPPVGSSVVWYTLEIGGVVTTAPTGTNTGTYTAWAESVDNTTSCISATRTEVTLTINALPNASASNDGPYCDGATINLFSLPNGMDSYDWATDAIIPPIPSVQNPTIAGADSNYSGTYTVTIEDANGCINTAQTTVLVYEPLDPGEIGTNHSICYSGDPSEITSVTDPSGGGDVWTTYEWQSRAGAGGWTLIAGANDLTYDPPAGLTETTHYRRRGVSTACGNTDWSNQVTVTVYDEVLGGTIGTDDDICYNDIPNPFTNDAFPTGGTDSWTYQWQYQEDGDVVWTPIASTNDPEYTHPTPLTVTTKFRRMATDALCGFAYSNEITINVWDAIDGGTISIADNEVCYNESPGTIQNASDPIGGEGITSFTWEQKVGAGAWTPIAGETNNTYDVPALTATTTFRRIASNNCGFDYSNELTITVNPLPVQYNVTGGGSYCEGEAGLEVGLDGSQSNVTYTLYLDAAPTATTLSGTGGALNFGFQLEGTYTVYAENDITSCVNTMLGSAIIAEVAAIDNNTISADQLICSGSAPAELTGSLPVGGTGVYTYQWYSSTNGVDFSPIALATNQNYSPAALAQTTYYRRDVISGVCSNTSNTIEITVNPPISNNTIGTSHTICYDAIPNQLTGSVPSGGNGAYDYQWQSSTAGAAGPYGDIGGATGQNYQPGNLTQDTWFRRIVSSPPCSDNTSAEIKVTVSPEFTITGFDTVDPECNGYSTGEAEVNHTGGIAPYFYSWSPSGQSTKRATGLVADVEYTVTVNDNQGCPASGVNTVTLSQPDAIAIDPADITVTNVTTCYGEATGSIEVVASGGTPDYVYTLYDDATFIDSQTPVHPATALFSGLLASNNYRISVTDANNCPAAEQAGIVLTQPEELVVDNVDVTQISCNGYNDATITITAIGGTPPYQYSIDGPTPFGTFQNENEFTGLGEGGYEIYVKDSKGCEASWFEIIEILNPPAISFTYSVKDITSCNGAPEGEISIYDVSGGSGTGYMYSIYDPPVWQEDPLFENLPGGPTNEYYISVMDSEGCVKVANNGFPVTINQPDPITYNIVNIVNVTGCWYNTNGSFRVQNATGGTDPKRVSIDGVNWFVIPKTFSNLGINTYTVTVRDLNGCEEIKTVDITGPPPIEISNIDVTDVECFGSTNGVIDITASGGTGDLYYTLTLGATTIGPQVNDGLFINLTNGDYDISITDDNGCELTDNATILSPDELILTTQVDDVTCSDSGNDGKITAKGNGGNPPYTITLFKGGIQQNQYTNVDEDIVVEFIGLAGGNDYEVEVDDTKGCGPVASGLLTVIVPDPLVINPPVIENLTCNGVPTGKVTVTGTGGNPPYTFVLYDSGDNALETLNDNAGVEFVDYPAATGYYVTIDDTNGCGPIATAPFDITEPDAITIDPLSVTTTDISCNGFDDGEVSVTATGGTGNLYYTLLQGGIPVVGFATQTNNGTFSPLEPGTYTISITDDESCGPVVSTDLVVNEPDPINLTVNVIDIVCNGDQGSITAQANQGTAPFDFVLSQDAIDIANFDDIAADTEVEFANLDAGDPVYTYVVTVTDANGCFVSSADLTIFEPSAIVIDSESSTPISCNGQDNGSISVDASGGTGILTYTLTEDVLGEITNNETGEFIDLEPGIYTVTIEDENGCAGPSAGPYNLTEPSAIEFDVDVTGLTCFGDEVTVTVINVIGGSGVGYQYSFDGGAFSPSNEYKFTPTEGGVDVNVIIVVKDDADCETTEIETITIPGELLIDVTIVSHPLCNGGNQGEIQATSTGGTPPIFYEVDGNGLWNSGGNFTDLSAGFHTVVVSDFKGCSNSTTVELIDPPAITIDPLDILAVDPTCSDPGLISVEATGGTGTLTYTLWEQTLGEITNNTTGLFENLGGGDYKVYVTDANNCGPDSTDIIPLVSPSTISVDDIIITHATGCFSITNPPENGSIEILASGGNGPLQYSIDNGVTFSSNNLFEGQKPGDYSIIVTDGICPEYRFINVGGPAEITYNIITEQAEIPTGAGNGLIFLEATGGTGTLTFTLWEQTLGEITNNTTGLFENLSNGVYHVEISDDSLCTVTTRDIFLAGLQVTITPTNVSCNGANDGQIEITVDGGTLPYTITWSNTAGPLPDFNDMLLITGLAPDTYTVYIVDSEGIDITLVQDITEPDELQTSTTITPPTCTGDTNGAILVEAQGGTSPYTYTLTDADSQEVTATSEGLYENLAAGDYTINIEDANGCTFSSLLTLPEAEPITYSVIKEHPTGFGETDGTIVVSALPDTYTYAFTLFTQSGTEVENNTTGSFSGLGAGSYYVIIENEFGCSVQTETIILTAITLEITPHPVSCFGGSDGWIEVEIFGGLPPFNTVVTSIETGETFDSGIGINAENAVLPAGSYTVSVTDNAGHTITQTAEVTQPAELIASIVEAVQPLCYGVASGYVVFNIEGGTPDYTISWDGGSATGLIAENLDAGTYLFTITDANGCEFVFEEEVVITYPEGMTLTNLSFFDIPCYGDNSGYISMYVEGGTLPVTYTVEGPEGFTESNNNGVFSQLLPGIYNLFITDANGCQYLFEEGNRIVINEPDSIEISTLVNEIDTLDCHYDVAGVINMQVSGGTPDYSYLWSNGQQTLDLYNPTPGTYTIRVTDSQGCTAFKDVKIPGPEPLMLDYNISLANCIVAPEGDVGGITINGLTGGNGVFPVDFSIEWYSEKLGHIENLDNVWDPIEQTYGYYTAVITDAKDCKDTLDFYIPFDETKNFTLELLAIDTACYGSDVEMSVAAYEYGVIDPQPYLVTNPEYMWFDLNTSDNEPVFEGEDSYTTVLTEKTKFRVDVMSGDGCLAQVTDSVDVHARMLPYIPRILEYHPFLINNYEDTTVMAVLSDTEYEFTVVEGGEGHVVNYSWTPTPIFFPPQYTWDEVWIDETVTPFMEFKTGEYEEFQTGEIISPSGKKEDYIPLILKVESDKGCYEEVVYKAIVLNQIRIPNAFSPNNDGINDFWKLPYAELFANMTVRVYNRWGALIWSAKGTEIGDGWDGKNSNGKDYPVGTYYYVIDYNVEGTTKWKSVSGSITIVR